MKPELQLARETAERMLRGDAASRRLGITIDIPAAGEAVATMTVTADMHNGHGVCHGGLLFTFADTAFAFACNGYGVDTLSSGGHIDFLHPARAGDVLTAHASERHRGRRQGVYDVTVRNQEGHDVALFRGQSVALSASSK
ncbi:MAG: hydroxyphenylacetyl-CoA thioesterase PaaI [Gammaproteobacteria bacterium]